MIKPLLSSSSSVLGLLLLILCSPTVLVVAQFGQDLFGAAQQQNCGDLKPVLVTIVNESKGRFDVFWFDKREQGLKQINDVAIPHKQISTFNSHVDQSLEIHEVPDEDTGECGGGTQTCRRALVEIKESGEKNNVFLITKDFQVERETDDLLIRTAMGEEIEGNFELINQTPSDMKIFWVNNNEAGALVELATINANSQHRFNSFAGNEFECQQVGPCQESNTCETVNFKNPGTGQDIVITPNFSAMAGDNNITL